MAIDKTIGVELCKMWKRDLISSFAISCQLSFWQVRLGIDIVIVSKSRFESASVQKSENDFVATILRPNTKKKKNRIFFLYHCCWYHLFSFSFSFSFVLIA